jgi:hypothetical protein
MTEISSDKTTRRFISALSNTAFCYQVSVFYNNYSDRLKATEHKSIITDQLPRTFPNQAFLYRLGIKIELDATSLNDLQDNAQYGEVIDMPYHTFFTTKTTEVNSFKLALERRLGCSLRIQRRVFNDIAKKRYVLALQKGQPHDLLGYFSDLHNQRRWALIGKKHLL